MDHGGSTLALVGMVISVRVARMHALSPPADVGRGALGGEPHGHGVGVDRSAEHGHRDGSPDQVERAVTTVEQ